jgi:protein tyrosine phosphatase (PTP) superfamily phosphohydrolase (DUF442 family)
MNRWSGVVAFVLSLSVLGCARELVKAEPSEAPSSYFSDTHRRDGLWVGGQPSQSDLAALKSQGVRAVFNLRTSEEMAELGFDQAVVLKGIGLSYQQWPVGGPEHPYTPALLEAFAQAMKSNDGKVLLHCAGGGRAAQLYAAWLVAYQGESPQQAMATLESFGGWPLPMERLLGKPLRVELDKP